MRPQLLAFVFDLMIEHSEVLRKIGSVHRERSHEMMAEKKVLKHRHGVGRGREWQGIRNIVFGVVLFVFWIGGLNRPSSFYFGMVVI